MTNRNRQIAELMKQGLNAAEVAQALDYPVEFVEAVLITDEEVKKSVERAGRDKINAEFSSITQLAVETMKELMEGANKESVRFAATAYILDQQLGLKEPKTQIQIFTAQNFNDRIRMVKERKRELEERCIEVESKVEKVAA